MPRGVPIPLRFSIGRLPSVCPSKKFISPYPRPFYLRTYTEDFEAQKDSSRNVGMSNLGNDGLIDTYKFAIQLGKDAGKILLDGLEKRRLGDRSDALELVEKMNAVDIVTQIDNGESAA